MEKLNYIKNVDDLHIFFSLHGGYNYYVKSTENKYTFFQKSRSVITHVKTGAQFYVAELPNYLDQELNIDHWIELISSPVDLTHYLWPVDVIRFEYDQAALVFPLRAMPVYSSFKEALSNDINLGWDKQWVKALARNFLNAMDGYFKHSYTYHEFSYDNMFYRADNYDVMFDFSLSTHNVNGLFDSHKVSPERIMPDHADSFYYSKERAAHMDLASDYYSIAVILFKLLVGRLPYQGTVMESEPNATALEHESWLKLYHKNTFFIFDANDDTNRIGGDTGFANDEIFVARWMELPEHVRSMFQNVFQYANVMRVSDNLIFYSPREWLSALFEADGDPVPGN